MKTGKEQFDELIQEADFISKNYPFPNIESTMEWQVAQTLAEAMEILQDIKDSAILLNGLQSVEDRVDNFLG